MSKQLFLVAVLLLIPLFVFSQSSNWLSSIDLNVSVNSSDRLDLYTDKDGNHIIVQKSNQLVYYLFSATGTQIRTSVRDNNVSEYPRLSRIVGWEGKLYVIYKEGNRIKTQKSTDAGATWSTTAIYEITMNSSTSNGLDAWTDANGVHLVYSEYDNSNSNYKTRYQRNDGSAPNWVEQKEVTDEANVSGGFPSVTTSANRVHVAFTAGDTQDPILNHDFAKSRDRYNGTWQSSQEIFDDAARSMVIATSSKLHGFYYDFVGGGESYYYNLYYKNRDLGDTRWSSPELLQYYYNNPESAPVDMAVTTDDRLHIVNHKRYFEWQDGWSDSFSFTSDEFVHQRIAANSNDIYVVWNNASTIKLRQRDYAPLAPQNLSVIASGNNHPLLSWNANNEADLDEYNIYKNRNDGWGWQLLNSTSATSYEDVSEIVYGGDGGKAQTINYKITAIDLEENESGYSNTVEIEVVPKPGYGPGILLSDGTGSNLPQMLQLEHNYPNPFNPATTIQFALSEDGQVELVVYDLRGQRISTLVNGYMEAGYHRATWNGIDQKGKPVSSGIYIYELKAGGQRLVKKMMLIK